MLILVEDLDPSYDSELGKPSAGGALQHVFLICGVHVIAASIF